MKKFFLLILITLTFGCGYKSIYENENQDLLIKIKNIEGDYEMNKYIENKLKISSNSNSKNIYELSFNTRFEKIILAKDTQGNATDYRLEVNVDFIIHSKGNQKVNFKESLKIKKNTENFEQTNYEREIKKNFSDIIKNKLILYLIR